MNFGDFLGNETLKERLSNALSRNQLSHCYLITGPVGSGKHTLARRLAATMQCTADGERPCGQCAQCRKALHGTHPDILTVDDAEKKTIPVKLVRDACADLYVRPNEGAKKIYCFPRAQDLNAQGQNALLKCIEEPPAYGVFFLLAEQPEQLLPTIRSRCVHLQLSPLPEAVLRNALRSRFPDASPDRLSAAAACGYLGQAITRMQEDAPLLPQVATLSRAYCERSPGAVLRALTPMERLKREQLRPILLQWHALLASALTCRGASAAPYAESRQLAAARTDSDILSAAKASQHALTLLDANVSPAHICGMLAIRLR